MLTPFGCSDACLDSALLEHAARQYRIECQRSLNYGLSLGANSQPVVVARQSMTWLCCVSYALFSSFRSHLSAPLSRSFRSCHWDRKWQTAGMTSASSWRSRDSTFEKCGIPVSSLPVSPPLFLCHFFVAPQALNHSNVIPFSGWPNWLQNDYPRSRHVDQKHSLLALCRSCTGHRDAFFVRLTKVCSCWALLVEYIFRNLSS